MCTTLQAQLRASFTDSAAATCAPVRVFFTDHSTGSPSQWRWTTDNGDTSSRQNPEFVFLTGGIHTVTLVVSAGSAKDTLTQSLFINAGVSAAFSYSYDDACAAPTLMAFIPQSVSDTLSYRWRFDNGITSNKAAPVTSYTKNGRYNVQLITQTPKGCTDTAVTAVSVGNVSPAFTSFSVVCKNADVLFTNTSEPVPQTVSWQVNGTTVSHEKNLTYRFANAGSYQVTMLAGFGSCSQSYDKSITVKEKPVPAFSEAGALQSCTVPVTVEFSNKSTNATSYKWLFGDTHTATTANATYTYTTNGAFSVSLVAYNGDGCSDTLTKNSLVRLGPPVISSFASLPVSGCIPVTVSATANIQSVDPVASYDWNTGDAGLHLTGSTLAHTYDKEGYYTVSLTVKTVNGCTGSFSQFQAVAAGTKPVPDFDVDSSVACASSVIHFIDKSSGNVSSWNWHYGDGFSGTGKSTQHLYNKTGYSDVTLYISNKGCNADPLVKKSFVYTKPPIADFSFATSCADQLAVQFTDKSTEPTAWHWDFGDGHHSSAASPNYSYSQSGQYTVVLTTANANCISTDTAVVVIAADKPKITWQPAGDFVCHRDSLTFSNIAASEFIESYKWFSGDGKGTSNTTTFTYAYEASGDYRPYVAVRYTNKCYDTVYTDVPLHVYGPVAAFTFTQQSNCLPADVVFTNNSKTDGHNALASSRWSYGNGVSTTIAANTHTYTYDTAGTFLPSLIVTDKAGCTDTAATTQMVQTHGAHAAFGYNTTVFCDSVRIDFTDKSTVFNDALKSYQWSFGDAANSSSSEASPSHTYKKQGKYTVRLTLTTAGGCTETEEQSVDVQLTSGPAINILAPDTTCVGSAVQLSVSSANNGDAWRWLLDDGSFVNGSSITHTFTDGGIYNIKVYPTTADACADTAVHALFVSELPAVFAGSDSFVCKGSAIELKATGADSYTWQSATNDISCTACMATFATPSYPSQYIVAGKNKAGCLATDTVWIDVQQPQTLTVYQSEINICAGQAAQLRAAGTDLYLWQPSAGLTNNTAATINASPTETTVYTVMGADSHHCFADRQTVTVVVHALPVFNIVDSVLVLGKGTQRQLSTISSADVAAWSWSPAASFSCATCDQPLLTAAVNGYYYGTAITTAGCTATDSVSVVLMCNKAGISIPTAFTPNGDGKNERFYPKSVSQSKIASFRIYNRNGKLVFQQHDTVTNNFGDGWDGKLNGLPLPADVYIYRIEVLCDSELLPFSGTVTLIR